MNKNIRGTVESIYISGGTVYAEGDEKNGKNNGQCDIGGYKQQVSGKSGRYESNMRITGGNVKPAHGGTAVSFDDSFRFDNGKPVHLDDFGAPKNSTGDRVYMAKVDFAPENKASLYDLTFDAGGETYKYGTKDVVPIDNEEYFWLPAASKITEVSTNADNGQKVRQYFSKTDGGLEVKNDHSAKETFVARTGIRLEIPGDKAAYGVGVAYYGDRFMTINREPRCDSDYKEILEYYADKNYTEKVISQNKYFVGSTRYTEDYGKWKYGEDSTTLYAKLGLKKFDITYDGNKPKNATKSVTGTTAEQKGIDVDGYNAVNGNGYKLDGWKFTEWNTSQDGSGMAVESEGQYSNLTDEPRGTVTLYAQWKHLSYEVRFDANGGNGSMKTESVWTNCEWEIANNDFFRKHYDFVGWNTARSGSGKSYGNREKVSNLAESGGTVTLYAQWKPKEYKITFDTGGGKWANGSTKTKVIKAVYGSTIKIPKAPNKKGCRFEYWKGSKYMPDDRYKVTCNHSFTAKWKSLDEQKDNEDGDKAGSGGGNGLATGDKNNLLPAVVMMLLSLAAIAVLLQKRIGRR